MKVGNRTVIFNETIYIPEGESAEFEYHLSADDILKCRFIFLQNVVDEDRGDDKGPFTKINFSDGLFEFNFCNFIQNPLGFTSKGPNLFGYSNKQEPLFYIAGVVVLSDYVKLHIQIMLGEVS